MNENDEEIVEENDSDHARNAGDDSTDGDAASGDRLKKLRQELKKSQEEKGEYLAGWQRAKADFVNRERVLKEEVVRMAEYTREKMLTDLLPILDGFEMAIASPTWQSTDPAWRAGMEALSKQLLSVLAKHSIEAFESIGQPFDPSKHEAVSTMPTTVEAEDHTVKQVLQKGYTAGDRVIRAAKVVIAEFKK